MEVLEHHEHGALGGLVGATDEGDEVVDDEGIVLFGVKLLVELGPLGFVGELVAQDLAEAQEEVGEGEDAVGFLREGGHDVAGGELVVLRDFIRHKVEEVGLADAAGTNEEEVVFGSAGCRAT